jgi:hypothetical protein
VLLLLPLLLLLLLLFLQILILLLLLIILLLGNYFTSSIPDEFYNLIHLSHFAINTCKLTGPLSSSISKLTSLEYVYLEKNDFSGSVRRSLLINYFNILL